MFQDIEPGENGAFHSSSLPLVQIHRMVRRQDNLQIEMAESPPVKIRKFKKEDLNKILEIEAQAFPKTAYSKEIFLSYAESLPDSFVVIERGGDMAGYMIFDRDGHIHSTAVRPRYRRMGFGRMLFRHASKEAKKNLWLEVRSKNSGAIAFYKSMGMKTIGKIPAYYGRDDALIMTFPEKREASDSNSNKDT